MFINYTVVVEDFEIPLTVEFDCIEVGLGYATGREGLDEATDPCGDIDITDFKVDFDELRAYELSCSEANELIHFVHHNREKVEKVLNDKRDMILCAYIDEQKDAWI